MAAHHLFLRCPTPAHYSHRFLYKDVRKGKRFGKSFLSSPSSNILYYAREGKMFKSFLAVGPSHARPLANEAPPLGNLRFLLLAKSFDRAWAFLQTRRAKSAIWPSKNASAPTGSSFS